MTHRQTRKFGPLRRLSAKEDTCYPCVTAEHIRDEKTAHQIKAIPDMLETLGIVLSLMDESSGVVGYHLNGEVATWEELGIREEVEAAIKKARGEE